MFKLTKLTCMKAEFEQLAKSLIFQCVLDKLHLFTTVDHNPKPRRVLTVDALLLYNQFRNWIGRPILRNLKAQGSLLRFSTDYYFAKTVTLRVLDALKQSKYSFKAVLNTNLI